MEKFIEKHAISGKRSFPEDRLIEKYKQILPSFILDFWKQHGFGRHSEGLFELVNPEDYEATLAAWLGRNTYDRIPLIITAFGNIIYYRKLTDTDEDISFLDVHYRDIHVLNWDAAEFFESDMTDNHFLTDYLDKELFAESLNKLGQAAADEIYSFVPALALGGAREISYVQKQKTKVHLDFLFQLS